MTEISQKRQYFGTDGIRGLANTPPITAEVIVKLAMAAASVFRRGPHRHTVVIGKDTRLSGYMIESALEAGFTSMGFNVILLGPIPTPAVAFLTKSLRADLGVMISASHNPYPDNGIKFFGPDGHKLSDTIELSIEQRMATDILLPPHKELGRAKRLDDAPGRYIEFAKSTFPKELRLDGLKIVVDCANGAAYKVAPDIFWELGAEIIPLGVYPDGFNINKGCGATDPTLAAKIVQEYDADLAVILDGDADRLILVDERGKIVDGDQILAMIATYLYEKGDLQGGGVVSTVMANLGLERYLKTLGLNLIRSSVGDRYVISSMMAEGMNIGGEPSGHIILRDFSTTGDGILAALYVLAILRKSGELLSQTANLFKPVPQINYTLPVDTFMAIESPSAKNFLKQAHEIIGNTGTLLVRVSGTENSLRLMAQGDDEELLHEAIDFLIKKLRIFT
jgi:phosphoglucosamine mutase